MNYGTLKQFGESILNVDTIICLIGAASLGWWLLKTSFGTKALADSPPRRNNMAPYVPFVPLLCWFGFVWVATSITKELSPDLSGYKGATLENSFLATGGLITILVTILLARSHFARQLKGFGLNPKTIPKDIAIGLFNLLSIWPIMTLAILLTVTLGKTIVGQDFQLQKHQELELITAYPQYSLRVLIVTIAVLIAPVAEEMLFRGMFQTTIRSFVTNSWVSIGAGSAMFTLAHSNIEHWPALLVLGAGLGYAYEKSGSLFRPIFMHSLFNMMSIVTAMYGG